MDVFQRTSRSYRKLFKLITCGSVCSRVSATLVIEVRRAVQVVLRVVVDWKWEGEAETSKEMTWLTGWQTLFMRTMMKLQSWAVKLEPQARISCSCLWEDCVVHDERYGCVFCVHPPSNCRYYVPAIRNCMLNFFFTHSPSSGFEECHHHEFQFCHDEDDEDKVCGRFPCCSLYHFHPVFRPTTWS